MTSVAGERVERTAADRRLGRYIAGCIVLAGLVAAAAAVGGPRLGATTPDPWLVALLWLATLVAGSVSVGLPTTGVGGVREYTSLLEIAAVLSMVFLAPVWAVAVAVTASIAFGWFVHHHEPPKIVFNTASEAIAIGLGSSVYAALAGSGFDASWRSVLAAMAGAAVYIAVNLGTFTGLVVVISGDALEAIRSEEMASSLLVSSGIATTGVMAGVLASLAPWALPLVVVPTVLDHLRARGRQQGLELAASKQAAEQANLAKSQFLARMSHEMRTPLNAMLGFGQLLEDDERLEPDVREQVQFILRSGWHLHHIVSEVLDLSQIEAGRMSLSLESVAIADVVTESVELVAPLAGQRRVRTDLVIEEEDIRVRADHQRLRQVLINLLSNAIKYGNEAGEITVTIRRAEQAVAVDVADQGIGIAVEDLDRLFVPFERVSGDQVDVEGTGLGLSVSKTFVEAMGGELRVTSEPGTGSTFTLVLPPGDGIGEELTPG
jgi:signal transduction histidine kinase